MEDQNSRFSNPKNGIICLERFGYYSSHMVLQNGFPIKITGESDPALTRDCLKTSNPRVASTPSIEEFP
jgi:hypothetical protein